MAEGTLKVIQVKTCPWGVENLVTETKYIHTEVLNKPVQW